MSQKSTEELEANLLEEERKLFESWARFMRADFERHPKLPERYVSVTTQTYWVAWQARADIAHAKSGSSNAS